MKIRKVICKDLHAEDMQMFVMYVSLVSQTVFICQVHKKPVNYLVFKSS